MFEFIDKKNTLNIFQVRDANVKIDLLKPHKDSYERYKTKTIYDNMEYLRQVIERETGIKDLQIEVIVKDLYSTVNDREVEKSGTAYYPVYARFTSKGLQTSLVEITRIPFMDDYCVFNFDGKRKTVMSELTNIEDISYDHKNRKVVVTLPNNHFSVLLSSKEDGMLVNVFGRTIKYHTLLQGFMIQNGLEMDLHSYFSNPIIKASLKNMNAVIPSALESEIEQAGFLPMFESETFKLGRLRHSLNRRLTIDPSLGYELSRDIPLRDGSIIKKGETVTPPTLTKLKKNLVNEVYIRIEPNLQGKLSAYPIHIDVIKQGARVTDLVKELLPQYKDSINHSRVSKDEPVFYLFDEGSKLTQDIIHLLYDNGYEFIECYKNKNSSDTIRYNFEQEIIGNYTLQLKDFMDEIPEYLDGDDYTYYHGITDPYSIKELTTPIHITLHDLLAVVSYTARVELYPELTQVYNRDLDFLKKVNLVNETFSNAMMSAVPKFVKTMKNNIGNFISKGYDEMNPFRGLYHAWTSKISEKKLLRTSNDINPISILTQANRLSTFVKSDKAVDANMRTLAMGFYGRICPYDTPAGTKIGLVNTIAIGCRIVDGEMQTPYRKVYRRNGKLFISDDIKYMNSLEEQKYIIGDFLSLKFDTDGSIYDTTITARVPAQLDKYEKVKFSQIMSHELDYVNAFGSQHLSATAALVPYAAGDDGARLGFSINLATQAIYIADSDLPTVYTDMYEHIFTYSNDFVLRAKANGRVIDISPNMITLCYYAGTFEDTIQTTTSMVEEGDMVKKDDIISESPIARAEHNGIVTLVEADKIRIRYEVNEEEVSIKVKETKLLNDALVLMDYKVKVGEEFEKGDILLDTPVSKEGCFSPGAEVLVTYIPWEGYNYEDAITPCEHLSSKFTSISCHASKKIVDDRYYDIHPRAEKLYRYIPRHGTVMYLKGRKKGDSAITKEIEWISNTASGILFDVSPVKDAQISDPHVKAWEAKMIDYNRLSVADKMAGRHGNKGVSGMMIPNSQMPTFKNGVISELNFNPCGVVSRMNVGQNLELHTGFAGRMLGIRIKSNSFNGASVKDIRILMRFIWDIANKFDLKTDSGINEMRNKYSKYGFPEQLYNKAIERFDYIKEWEGCFYPDGTADMYNPDTGKMFYNRVAFGYSYIYKIKQEVETKLHVRAGMLEEPYSPKDYQPTEGASRGGGQRAGEMEVMGILSHGASNFADETMNEKSDNVGRRVEMEATSLNARIDISSPLQYVPRTVNELRYYMETWNLKVESDMLPGVTQDDIDELRQYEGGSLLRMLTRNKNSENSTTSRVYEPKDNLDEAFDCFE